MDRKDAMITVDDGIRKLRLLDAKGKVWTQEMLLQVDDKAVSLIDADNKVRSADAYVKEILMLVLAVLNIIQLIFFLLE